MPTVGASPAAKGTKSVIFAKKHGITKDQAEGLIKRIGNDRNKLNAAAEKLKK